MVMIIQTTLTCSVMIEVCFVFLSKVTQDKDLILANTQTMKKLALAVITCAITAEYLY